MMKIKKFEPMTIWYIKENRIACILIMDLEKKLCKKYS